MTAWKVAQDQVWVEADAFTYRKIAPMRRRSMDG